MIAYSIDSFRAANDRCFGWGWFLDSDSPARAWMLRIRMADGSVADVPGTQGGDRADVAEAFPQVRHAASAAFLIHGHLHGELDDSHPAMLHVDLEDGRQHVVEVPAALLVAPPAPTRLVDRWRALVGRARHYRSQHGVSRLLRRASQRAVGWAALKWLQHVPTRATVVFDHDLGGGANTFRTKLLADLPRWRPRLLVTPVLDRLAYRVRVALGPLSGDAHLADLRPVAAVLRRVPAPIIHVNELVSFPDPAAVITAVVEARRRSGSHLTFYLHDFHAVCPSWTLLDWNDRFCGVPDVSVCAGCLAVNHGNTLGFVPRGGDVTTWRRTWLELLKASDEIRAFSNASAAILRRAYPELDPSVIRVEGHVTRRLRPVEPYRPQRDETITVAIAGHISIAKGARIVVEMGNLIVERGLPMRLVIFGTLGVSPSSAAIEVHGSYRSEELPALLEQYSASAGFLPSICAETFSYVTDEFMAMQMPFASFPIGAPAERLAHYPRGLVIDTIDAGAALDQLLDFVRTGRAFTELE